ncbi:hypothetical protein TBC1_12480 [Lentimicrobium saccharophilum]|uniref:VRR-NUC domain-containing protein n=1 Tax=Lentimicrobium saccharophilum TaxID=1678841 RepID=A0A0S7BVS5_9BACT|nr:hypothetical protein TBC1_12480 [Lentimicrobium saccharophilum]
MTAAIQILRQMAAAEMKRKHTSYPENLTLPVKPYNDKTANGLTRCIIDFLKFSGWQAERINTTGRPVDRREIVTNVIGQKRQIGSVEWIRSGSTPGSADISATIRGRSVKIEVKIGSDRQSEAQIRYQQAIEKAGGIYIVARTFEQFYGWYQKTFN